MRVVTWSRLARLKFCSLPTRGVRCEQGVVLEGASDLRGSRCRTNIAPSQESRLSSRHREEPFQQHELLFLPAWGPPGLARDLHTLLKDSTARMT